MSGKIIICKLNDNNKKTELAEYYDIRYDNIDDAFDEEDIDKYWYLGVSWKPLYLLPNTLPFNLTTIMIMDCKLKKLPDILPINLIKLVL